MVAGWSKIRERMMVKSFLERLLPNEAGFALAYALEVYVIARSDRQ